MNIDYTRVMKHIENNAGPLSVEGVPLEQFFIKIMPISDRSMVEYFMRTELNNGNPVDQMTEIVPGLFWGTSGIQNFIISDKIKKCATNAFQDSDLRRVSINSALDGVLDLDIFAGAKNLEVIHVDPSIVPQIKKLHAQYIMQGSGQKFVLEVPKALNDALENGNIEAEANDKFFDYISSDDHYKVF